MLNYLLQLFYLLHLDRIFGWEPRGKMRLYVAETFARRLYSSEYDKNLQDLLGPLTDVDRDLVKTVIQRHHYILTHNLLDRRKLFSAEEIKLQRILCRQLPVLATQLGLETRSPEASVLWYHHGLRNTKGLPPDLAERFHGKAILDVGASVGDSAAVFSRFYKPARIYSFEPDISRIARLRSYLESQQIDNVDIVPCALGEAEGKLPDGSKVRTIDEFVAISRVSVGLVKMDIEGAEESAIRGATATLLHQKPLLIVSMYHNGAQFYDLLPLIRRIQPEYQFAIRKLDDRSPVYETTLFCW